ncbi:MAG: fibrobacter succinogenes major paralogous domain-containing protein [Bacteroidia bacterium]
MKTHRYLPPFILFMLLLVVQNFSAQVTRMDSAWATRNLEVVRFRDGQLIPEVKTDEEWAKAAAEKRPAWCYYKNELANGKKYGKLYNWYAVNDPRGLAPKGWHIPSDAEWTKLLDSQGGQSSAGKKLKSLKGWIEEGNGTNESGFNAFPGGMRLDQAGTFTGFDKAIGYWTSTEAKITASWCYSLSAQLGSVIRTSDNKGMGYYVRCVKDK